jgi:tetrahydromethanopterin S-methyltransferase subunit G
MKRKTEEISLESVDKRLDHLDGKIGVLEKEMHEGFDRVDSEIGKIGVICERLETKFSLLMEGFGGLDRRMEAFEARTEERFTAIDYEFEVVFKRLDDIDERLAKGIQTRGAFGI